MSMIEYQIKELRNYERIFKGDRLDGNLSPIFGNAADTIETLSTKLQEANMERSTAYYNGGWIPCNNGENLPSEAENDIKNGWCMEVRPSDYILCETNDGNIFKGFYSYANKTWTDFKEIFEYDTDEVIRWKQLPKTYKPQ